MVTAAGYLFVCDLCAACVCSVHALRMIVSASILGRHVHKVKQLPGCTASGGCVHFQ